MKMYCVKYRTSLCREENCKLSGWKQTKRRWFHDRWKLCVLSHFSLADSLPPHGLYPARLLCPWDSSGKNTGVGCHASSRGSSRPRNQTHVSCIAGGFFTSESPGKPHSENYMKLKFQCRFLKVLLKHRHSHSFTYYLWLKKKSLSH